MTGKSPKTKPSSPTGLYLHIPFCHARCGYCDFVTFTGKEDRIDQYVSDLCKEITMASSPAVVGGGQTLDKVGPPPVAVGGDVSKITTIFFGGGTPSLLSPAHVQKILDSARENFDISKDAEISLEANPESVTFDKALGWRNAGVNRLSIGLQAYDDRLLKAADRLHSVREFEDAFHACREAGFENINVDLIYGLPKQSFEDWKNTIQRTLSLRPEHLSMYALKVEEHTPFHAAGISINDDLQAEMYEWARTALVENAYAHYEISNFALPGKECRHNLIYWRQDNYLGLGVGAVGCMNAVRWENHKNLADYGKDISNGKLPRVSEEILSFETQRFERLMLGLRLREGLLWDERDPVYLAERDELRKKNLLEHTAQGLWRIPDAAILLTNQVLQPFLK
jgi:oxygen-independent coproporphyrinogen III oxidase